jgi:hypothetical protein
MISSILEEPHCGLCSAQYKGVSPFCKKKKKQEGMRVCMQMLPFSQSDEINKLETRFNKPLLVH